MAWPLDAVSRTYGSLQPVESADLNDWQARIVDTHRLRRHIVLVAGEALSNAGWQLSWSPFDGIRWSSVSGSANMAFQAPVGTSGRVKSIRVKCYMPDANVPSISLYRMTHQMSVAAGVPSHAQIGASASPAWGGVGAWDVVSWGGLDELVDEDESIYVVVLGAVAWAAAHLIAGVEFEIQPLTPTP